MIMNACCLIAGRPSLAGPHPFAGKNVAGIFALISKEDLNGRTQSDLDHMIMQLRAKFMRSYPVAGHLEGH